MKKIIKIFLFIIFYFFFVKNVSALTFDLVAPEGQLERGQEVKFTINIDTEGKSYGSTQIGMTYETQYLEYISVSAGDTFTTVSATSQGEGKLIITGTSTNGYSGSGVFAYVTFKIIAASSGSTQVCALFNPDTPTNTPAPPPPTALPTSGTTVNFKYGLTIALIFFALAGSAFALFKHF